MYVKKNMLYSLSGKMSIKNQGIKIPILKIVINCRILPYPYNNIKTVNTQSIPSIYRKNFLYVKISKC